MKKLLLILCLNIFCFATEISLTAHYVLIKKDNNDELLLPIESVRFYQDAEKKTQEACYNSWCYQLTTRQYQEIKQTIFLKGIK